jgi:DDE superfamily endonuclease
VGFVLAWRKPGNPLGWIILGVAVFLVLSEDASFYTVADYRLHQGTLPLGWVALLAQPGWAPGIVLFGLVVLLFPDGRPPSPRLRWMAWVYAAAAVLWIAAAVTITVGAIIGHHTQVDSGGNLLLLDNSASSPAWWVELSNVFFTLGTACWLVTLAAQVLSYRRSSGVRRQQLKWLMAGSAVAFAGITPTLLNSAGTPADRGPDLAAQHIMQPGQRAVIAPGREVPVHRPPDRKPAGRYRQAHPVRSRLAWLLKDLPVELLGRLRSDRVMQLPVSARRPGTMGRPRKHGGERALADPATWPAPQVTTSTATSRYGTATAAAWDRVHPRLTHRAAWLDHDGPLPVIERAVPALLSPYISKVRLTSRICQIYLWDHAGHGPSCAAGYGSPAAARPDRTPDHGGPGHGGRVRSPAQLDPGELFVPPAAAGEVRVHRAGGPA